MTEVTKLAQLLEDGDPLRHEGGMSPTDADRMRRRVVAPAFEPTQAHSPWQRPFALAAVVVLLVIVGTSGNDRAVQPTATPAEPIATSVSTGDTTRRQLQFSTAGGTRIIWIFDDNLRLQEPMP
jgi:hypothetical protein